MRDLDWINLTEPGTRSPLTLDSLIARVAAFDPARSLSTAKMLELSQVEETLLRDPPKITFRSGAVPEGPSWSLEFEYARLLRFPLQIHWTTDRAASIAFSAKAAFENREKLDRAFSVAIFILEALLAGDYRWPETFATTPENEALLTTLSEKLRAECPRFFTRPFLPPVPESDGLPPPELEWVCWANPLFSGADRETLPAGAEISSPPPGRRPRLSAGLLADLPPGLGEPEYSESISRSSPGTALADEFFIKMADYAPLSLRELFRNRNLASALEKWAPGRLPRISLISPAWINARWLNLGRSLSYLPEYRVASATGEQAILSWLERLLAEGVPVYVGASIPPSEKTTNVARLREIEQVVDIRAGISLRPGEPAWSTGELSISKRRAEEFRRSSPDAADFLSFDPASGKISISAQKSTDLHLSSANWELPPTLEGHGAIADYLNQLAIFSAQTGIELVDLPRRETIEVKPEIWFERDGTFAISFSDTRAGFRAWNIPPAYLPLLRGFVEGVLALTARQSTEIVQKKSGDRRRRDLRAIRHAGLYAMLFGERTSFASRNMSLADVPIASKKDLEQELESRLLAFLGETGAANAKEGRKPLFSPTVTRLLAEIGEPSIRTCPESTPVFFEGHETTLEKVGPAITALLRALVRYRALASGGASFMKTRGVGILSSEQLSQLSSPHSFGLTPLSTVPDQIPESRLVPMGVLSPTDPDGAILRAELFGLEADGFDFYWAGKRIESLDPADLRLVLDIRDGTKTDSANPLDWFALQPEVFLRGRKVAPEDWVQGSREGMLEYEGTLYRIPVNLLPSLKRLESFWERISGKGSSDAFARSTGGFHRLPRAEALEVLSMMDSQIEFSANPRFTEIREAFQRLGEPSAKSTNIRGLVGKLKDYQFAGVQWLSDLHSIGLGGILADDMGLGKTVQTLAFLARLRQEGRLRPDQRVLVIVPTSLVGNWIHEAATFVPGLRVSALHPKQGLPPPGGVSVVTYGLLGDHPDFFAGADWEIAVFDEAQSLKNLSAVRTTAARRLGARMKFALTGTPLENHFGEFFSILDLCVPGSLGEFAAYQKRFITPNTIQPTDLNTLRHKIKPLLLRRMKEQVLSEFPEKFENRVGLDFDPAQRKLYRDTALSWSGRVRESVESLGESKSQMLMLTALLRLRQICSDPSLIEGVHYTGPPPKVEWLVETAVERIKAGESILVFGQFIGSLERTLAAFQRAGIPAELMTGATTGKNRTLMIDRFQRGVEPRALLMTLKTGGVGLNLTRANHVFHIDPWWNPAVEDQATARAHRIGQKLTVQVHRLLMNHSVEEKIELLKERKRRSFDQLLSAAVEEDLDEAATASARSGAISRADFDYLIADWK